MNADACSAGPRIVQGNGAKDRPVIISDSLLALLRDYWRLYRHREWLFPGPRPDAPIGIDTVPQGTRR